MICKQPCFYSINHLYLSLDSFTRMIKKNRKSINYQTFSLKPDRL